MSQLSSNLLLDVITRHAGNQPDHQALIGLDCTVSYSELAPAIMTLQNKLATFLNQSTIAVAIDNHPAWLIVDLAATANKNPLVPLPAFFSNAQTQHAVLDAGATVLITDNPSHFKALFAEVISAESAQVVANKMLTLLTLVIPKKALPPDTAKITYTSGTTGNPKGVCLSLDAMLNVANSIRLATNLQANHQHLCVLPLATLLENVAGVYAALLAGASIHLWPSHQVGLAGSTLNIKQLHAALTTTHANTAIFIPEMLQALVQACETGAAKLPHLNFLAVGGASVSPQLLQRAAKLGLPVFEGYGLSESASVVSLNTTLACKIGSAGKPLPHIQIEITAQHEIFVKGSNLLGYTGEQALTLPDEFIDTGDIGYLDEDGFLFINGRKKNVFITSFGRNVSPEWVERELQMSPYIAQVALFGEARPWNVAIIVLRQAVSATQLEETLQTINANLPDYARIKRWIVADAPFSVENQQLTSNGRNRRDHIWQHYQHQINALYEGNH